MSASSVPACGDLRAVAGDGEVIATVRPEAVVFDVAASEPPAGWSRDPSDPLQLSAPDEGSASAVGATRAGRHTLWLRGQLHREIEVLVDRRRVATAAEHLNTPRQWIELGTVELTAGEHRIELRRAGASLAPGDAQSDAFGPVVAVPDAEPRLVRAPARALCGRPLDWVERPG